MLVAGEPNHWLLMVVVQMQPLLKRKSIPEGLVPLDEGAVEMYRGWSQLEAD